jgi:predicted transcriptional regulator
MRTAAQTAKGKTVTPKSSGTKVKTAKTIVTEYEEQEIALRAIEVLPEILQVRAKLDPKWCKQYSDDRANGATFPPIILFRLPDGRIVVTDGFHRFAAWKAIGLKTIRAQIREGTMHEALLAAIEANRAEFHRGRPFDEKDRRHAVEMLAADSECASWSATRIAKLCGTTTATASKYLAAYRAKNNIAPPPFIETEAGTKIKFKARSSEQEQLEPCYAASTKSFYKSVNGNRIYLGTNKESAREKLRDHVKQRSSISIDMIMHYLLQEGYPFRYCTADAAAKYPGLRGIVWDDVIAYTIDSRQTQSVQVAHGSLRQLRTLMELPNARLVCVCYPEDGPQAVIELAKQDGIEFLTPDEIVASLKPTPEPGATP